MQGIHRDKKGKNDALLFSTLAHLINGLFTGYTKKKPPSFRESSLTICFVKILKFDYFFVDNFYGCIYDLITVCINRKKDRYEFGEARRSSCRRRC